MNRMAFFAAGICLAGGLAAAQESDPAADRATMSNPDLKPELTTGPATATDYGADYDMQVAQTEVQPPDDMDDDMDHDMSDDMDDDMDSDMDRAADRADRMTGKGLTDMAAADLEGKKVVTLTGEEVGEISAVGTSAGQEGRVAVVDVGGFLGVGEKSIAIPLSGLEKSVSDEDSVRTSMTRETIESQPELDDTTFTPDE